MLRSLARKYLPLTLATWFSLFIGLSPINAVESHLLGKFGTNDNWTAVLGEFDDSSLQCMASTTNAEDESIGIFLKQDGSASLMVLYPHLIVPQDKLMSMEMRVGNITWTLEDSAFERDVLEDETVVTFYFPSEDKSLEFLLDLTKSPVVTLHEPGVDTPFSLWFFDGYTDALRTIQQCQSRIRTTLPPAPSSMRLGEKSL